MRVELGLGVELIKPTVFEDDRGYFMECWRQSWGGFVQENESWSRRGVVRGLHLQRDQAKLVRCVTGIIRDVAVDLRPYSETYGRYISHTLSGLDQLYIPAGFAHGFQALEDSLVQYRVSEYYDPALEAGVHHLSFGLTWELPAVVSERDRGLPLMGFDPYPEAA